MTRFARAKGSKASNEKAPEEATPWNVMKEQLLQAKKETEDAKNRQAAEHQRIENYENFLKDRKVQKRTATWCDFPEAQPTRNEHSQNQPVKKKKYMKALEKVMNRIANTEIQDHSEIYGPSKNKNKKNKNDSFSDTTVNEPEASNVQETLGILVKNKKNKYIENKTQTMETTCLLGEVSENLGSHKKKKKPEVQLEQESEVNPPQNTNIDSCIKETKSQNKKRNKIKKQVVQLAGGSNINQDDADSYNTSAQVMTKNNNVKSKNKKIKHQGNSSQADHKLDRTSEQQYDPQKNKNLVNKQNKEKAKTNKKKLVDGKPVRRKEINDKSFQLIIGGKEVELVRYDGFPVMKKDAERLAELKNSMIKKGIPKSEVQRTMKLERRRAEKALARVRKEVCYNCRKGGHNLSDCPELKSKIPGADAPEGVCFKCGSTEHRQFECKVQRDKEFRFATCFICKEPGHIARQCPDNPKGLYPNGGSCKLCGDVTHLRKDCPTASSKKEETSVKLQTLDSTNDIEGIGIQNKSVTSDFNKKPKKIRF